MFSKKYIFDSLDGFFSNTGIKLIDGEYRLVGKWCEIVPLEDGNWDIWFHNVREPLKPLHGKRIAIIKSIIPRGVPLNELTGEIWIQVPLEDLISITPSLAAAGGIRRKKVYSEETKERLLTNFD